MEAELFVGCSGCGHESQNTWPDGLLEGDRPPAEQAARRTTIA
jgi:hypothetical protein